MTHSYPWRAAALSALLAAALAASGCGGSDDAKPAKGDTAAKTVTNDEPKLSDGDVKRFLEGVSSNDSTKMEAVKDVVSPGSLAAAYLQQQGDYSNALVDSGVAPIAATLTEVDGGYKKCGDPEDTTTCSVVSGFESVDGKLATFKIGGSALKDRVSVGDGSKVRAGDLASVEFLSAYKTATSGEVIVTIRVASRRSKINLDAAYQATYRGDDKRQSTAVDALAPSNLDPDSRAYVALIFKASAIGGVVKLSISDTDYTAQHEVTIKTR